MKKLFSFLTVLALLLSINSNYVFSQDEQFRQEPVPKDEVRTPMPFNLLQQNTKTPFSNPLNTGSPIFITNPGMSPNATTVTIGSGVTTTSNFPLTSNYGFSYSQQIYTQAQINTAGQIQKLRFYWSSGAMTNSSDWVIYMGHTSKTTFSTTTDWVAGASMTQVFNGSVPAPSVAGWMEITLSTPFDYNNVDNLVIAVDENTSSFGSLASWRSFTSGTNTGIYYRNDVTNPDPFAPPTATGRSASIDQIQLDLASNTPMTFVSSTTEQVSTLPVLKGTTNQEIIRLQVVTNGIQSPFDVTSITFNTAGSTSASDISNAKVYYTNSTTFSTATQFGSTVANPNGSFTVTGTKVLGDGNNYFWLAYDIAAGATDFNVVDAQCTQFVTSEAKANRTPDVTDPGGSRTVRAPLSGVYTIDQGGSGLTNYTTFTAAIDELNLLGISGPVTFNVAAGQTWDKTVPAAPYNYAYGIFTTGTESNPITFQKSGGGANPILNILGTSATNDVGVWFYGDYTTFNGIDVFDAGTASADYLDYGYYLQGAVDDNCKYVTIKNCTVDLTKANTSSRGIYLLSNAPTSVANTNRNNKFYNNTVQDAYNAYYFTTNNSTYLGDGNEIGIDGGTSLIDNIGGGTSTVYAIYAPYETNFKLFNTTISNVTASTAIYCFYDGLGATSTHQIYNNTFTNVTGTSTSSSISGIYISSSATCDIYNNIFKTFTATYTVYPIFISTVTTTNIYNNKIYDIAYSGASTYIAYGIYISGGTNHYIYNNFIYDIKAPSATSSTTNANVRGLSLTGGTNAYVYYNTVFLDYTAVGATNQSAALYVGTSPILDLRNNIFVNNVDVTTNGTRAVAFYKTTTSLTNFATTSNNNLYYTGVLEGSAKNLIFYDGTNPEQTLAGYKTRMATRDQNAASENPPFEQVVSPYNLKIKTNVATQVESGGQRVTTPIAVTTDFENDLRWGEAGYTGGGSAPDIGADEFTGIPIDINGPTIIYTPLVNTTSTTDRVLSNVTITDPSGVNVNPGTAPRVYYKKLGDANTYAGNTDTDDGWKWVETTSGATPFSFMLDYTRIFNGVVSAGDIIQYFVIAQDVVGTPNVSLNSGTPAKPLSSVDLTDQEFPLTGTINQYSIAGSVSGIVLVGTGQTYTSLTSNDEFGLFKAINDRIVTGNLTVKIVSDLTETGAVALNQTTEEAMYTITIQPNDATLKTISGSYAGGLIRLNGADGITFDGRFEGSGNYLTFSNTSTSGSAVFQLISLGTNLGATDNTIRNCNISTGTSSTATYGVHIGGSTLGSTAADNDNNALVNNVFTTASNGIYAIGTASVSSGGLDNLSISGNSVTCNTSVASIGIRVGYALNSTIELNTLDIQQSASGAPIGISLETGVNSTTVSRNLITRSAYTGSGGYGGRGITVGTGSASSNITISNNVIYGVTGDNYSSFGNSSSMGISIGVIGNSSTLTTTTGGVNLYYNSVNMYGTYTRATACITTALYVGSGASALNIQNNIFANSMDNLGTASTGYAIYSAAANTAFTVINYNDYYASGDEGVLGFLSTNKTTLPDWVAASGGDANSIAVNPSFVSETNLKPFTGSPVLAAGTPVVITIDFEGTSRNGSNPSIGAYETGQAPAALDFLNLQSPSTATITEGQTVTVYARVEEAGITPPVGQGAGIEVWVGWSNANTDPSTWTNWIVATYFGDQGTMDEYSAALGTGIPFGTYYFATRGRITGGAHQYGGYSAGGGGFWNGTTNVSGQLTVNPMTITSFPYFEGFEGGVIPPAGWSNPDGFWIRGTEAHTGSYCASISYAHNPLIDGILRSPLFVLPANMRINFWWKDDDITAGDNLIKNVGEGNKGNPDIIGYDYTYFEISTNGTDWTLLATLSEASPNTNYIQQITDLSAYGGQSVYLRWRDNTDASFSAYGTGLDDIVIEQIPAASNTQPISAGNTDPIVFTGTGTTIQFTIGNIGALSLTVDKIMSTPGGTLPGGLLNLASQYWAITVMSGTVDGTYSITLDLTGVPGVVDPATIHLIKRNNEGGTWTDEGVADIVNGLLLTWTGLTSFSNFGLAGLNDNPLPVQLSSFTSSINNRDVVLKWITSSEINNAGFDVERSDAGINQWVKTGYVSGKGTVLTPTTYTFEDKKLNTGKYNYRLKQIDQNGNFTYYNLSSVVEVGLPTKFDLSQNYPNPFNPVTKIDFALPLDAKVSIKLYDITGREVKTLVNEARTAGYYTVQFNASDLSSGTYFYRIMTKSSGADYIMTKKMVLIK